MTKRGTVMRDRTVPTGVPSPAQIAVRNNMRKDGAAWQTLSVVQQQAWNAYASKLTKKGKKSGKAYVPSGYQVYTALTTKWYQCGNTSTPPVAPPTSAFAGDALAITVATSTGQVTWTANAVNSTNVVTEVLLQPLKGKSRKPSLKGYTSRAFAKFVTGGLSYTVVVPTGYYAAAYRYVNVATGQETALVPMGTQTVALSVAEGGAAHVSNPTPAPPQGEVIKARAKRAA